MTNTGARNIAIVPSSNLVAILRVAKVEPGGFVLLELEQVVFLEVLQQVVFPEVSQMAAYPLERLQEQGGDQVVTMLEPLKFLLVKLHHLQGILAQQLNPLHPSFFVRHQELHGHQERLTLHLSNLLVPTF